MEVFEDVKGYEGFYQISNLGRVKSLPQQGSGWFGKTHILKQRIGGGGYWVVGLTKSKVQIPTMVHRLIATAFIPNPENKKFVNHKNGIKTDYRIENLEWCTSSENAIHSWANGLSVSYQDKLVIDLETGIYYDTIKSAAIAKNIGRTILNRYLIGSRKNKTSLVYA